MSSRFMGAMRLRNQIEARHRPLLLASGLVMATVLLSGCAVSGNPSDPGSAQPTSPEYWKTQLNQFVRTHGDGPKATVAYGESEARSIAATKADTEWTRVVAQFPHALRPADSFVHWQAGSADTDVKACYVGAGATVDHGTDSDGNSYLGYSGPNSATYAAAAFDCGYVKFPLRPVPPPTSAQISYYYDYLTTFVVPCYLAHGAKVDPAPTRADFISQYQSEQARWAPTPPNAGDGPNPVYDGKDAVCSLREPDGNTF